jgi:hypothetical protein
MRGNDLVLRIQSETGNAPHQKLTILLNWNKNCESLSDMQSRVVAF